MRLKTCDWLVSHSHTVGVEKDKWPILVLSHGSRQVASIHKRQKFWKINCCRKPDRGYRPFRYNIWRSITTNFSSNKTDTHASTAEHTHTQHTLPRLFFFVKDVTKKKPRACAGERSLYVSKLFIWLLFDDILFLIAMFMLGWMHKPQILNHFNPVFPKLISSRASLLASKNNHGSSHPCSRTYRVSGWHYVKLQIYSSELILDEYRIYVFCIYLGTNSDLCHLYHKLIGFYNRDEKCLLRGTKWVFK